MQSNTALKVPQVNKPIPNAKVRRSSDSVWPLRRADGTRFCDPPLRKD